MFGRETLEIEMPRFKLPSTMVKALTGIGLGLAISSSGLAQTAPAMAPEVTVQVGSALAAKAQKLGETDVKEMVKDLAGAVRSDLEGHHRASAPVRADLILEDMTPNRPTVQQLSDNPGLSEESIALGGAAISGVVTFADGHTESLSYTFRQTSLQDDLGVGQWTDAERAFDYLGDDLAHGHIPHDRLSLRVADSGFDQWRH
jgi:hypothetical protein